MGPLAMLWQLRMDCPDWVMWGSVGLTSSSSLLLQVTVLNVTVQKTQAQVRRGFLVLKSSFAVEAVKLVAVMSSEFLG